MIEVNVKCPHCGKSLMDDEVKIDDRPSVKVNIQYKGERGRLRLSSLYGSYNIQSEVPIKDGHTVKFLCPHCNTELTSHPSVRSATRPWFP
jgi:predicted RNA-binding Zn-ribbon protein involved in translation (DUF1610 family)